MLSGDGSVARAASFDLGVGHLKPGEAEERFEREIRPRLQATGLPAILCGMVGSELGWSPTPHLRCPATLDDARAAAREVSPGVRIVPGLRCVGLTGAPDVMRGEETQIFGWLEQAPERKRGRHLICHPGTHSKWILVEGGAVVRFATAMTGELFDLLRRHSVLRTEAEPTDAAAFAQGLEVGRSGLLLSAALFTARGRRALGELSAAQASSYLSGVLIGAEVAAMPGRLWPEAERVVLIGSPALTGPYAEAMQALGHDVETHDGDAAARAGLLALASASATSSIVQGEPK